VTTVALGLAIVGGACGASSPATIPIERPPLGSPPDPGRPPETDDLSLDQRLAAEAATVGIRGIACGRMVTGTGFAVEPDLIATSAHVIVGIDEITVETSEATSMVAIPVAFDPINDLALLQVTGYDFVPLALGTATDGTTGALFVWDATDAVTSKPFRIDRPLHVQIEMVAGWQTVRRPSWLVAADISRGDSGAPLVSSEGHVVGVAFASSTNGTSASYAVRAAALETLITATGDTPVELPDC